MRDGVRPASSCLANVVYPWSQLTLPDPNFNASNGFPPRKVYVEAVDYLPGLAGESRNFDANGAYIRVLLTGGPLTYSLQPRGLRPGRGSARRDAADAASGRQAPAAAAATFLARRSPPIHQPVRPDRPPLTPGQVTGEARDQDPPGRLRGDRRVARARRSPSRATSSDHERCRFPFIQSSAVHDQRGVLDRAGGDAGPGPDGPRRQACRSAISAACTLRNGIADRQAADRPAVQAPDPHQRDGAAAPTTGLKDMFVELDPGSANAPAGQARLHDSGLATPMPDINVDEILSSLDGDTRAYLDLLVNGAGQGLQGTRRQPARPGARAVRAHASGPRPSQHGRSPARRRTCDGWSTRCSASTPRWRPSRARSCRSSTPARRCSARSPPRRANVSRAVADLPGNAEQATATLERSRRSPINSARRRRNLLPAARHCRRPIGPLAALAKPSAAPIVAEPDPAVRGRRRPASSRTSSPAAVNLATATPNLQQDVRRYSTTSSTCSATRPGGGQHGYLWWLAWLEHNTAHAVLGPGRQRRLAAAVHPVQLAESAVAPWISGPACLNPIPILVDKPIVGRVAAGAAGALSLLLAMGGRTRCDGSPSIVKIVSMVVLALSCLGLLLFFWLSFG